MIRLLLDWILTNWLNIILITALFYVLRQILFVGSFTNLKKNMSGKIVIVTGSSSGIGKETAYQLLEDGATVIFACRNEKKTLTMMKKLEQNNKEIMKRAHYINLDLGSFNSVIKFVKEFKNKFSKIDILINNAGAFPIDFSLSEDNLDYTLQSNHLSIVALTELLLDHFDKNEGRIINVSSFAHGLADWSVMEIAKLEKDIKFSNLEKTHYCSIFKKFNHYANSKLSNIYYTSFLSENLEKNYPHIKTTCLNPGIVYTAFARFFWEHRILGKFYQFLFPCYMYIAKTAFSGAQTSLHLCYIDQNEVLNGGYYNNCKLGNISKLARDVDVRNCVIKYSFDLLRKHKDLQKCL